MFDHMLLGCGDLDKGIEFVEQRRTAAGIAFEPVRAGARQRPSGVTLRWKALSLRDDAGGLLPFFIEWSKDAVHPASDAPKGCRVERFELAGPKAEELGATVAKLQLGVNVATAPQPALRALLKGPKGTLALPG